MDLDVLGIIESLVRWLHVVAGIAWIGHLYFFNWVNGYFAATMDGETKKKVVPELMPRALYVFRWGAAWTWFTGLYLVLYLYYHSKLAFEGGQAGWNPQTIVLILLLFAGVFIYDAIMKAVKNVQAQAAIGLILASGYVIALRYVANFSFRGCLIHMGALFGTIMAFNVWFRIWPAQQKIITGVKTGVAADAALPALAGLRSRHNTYMSVPLVFAMLAQHNTTFNLGPGVVWVVPVVIALGWGLTWAIYNKTKGVKGF